GRARKLTLQGGVTLAAARKLAADALLEVAQGKDPAVAKRAARRTAGARGEDTVARLADEFIEKHAKRHTRPNSLRATAAAFRNTLPPAWARPTVQEPTRRDVIELLDGIVVDRPLLANKTRGVLSRFFSWLASRDVIAASPVVGVKPPAKETARDR